MDGTGNRVFVQGKAIQFVNGQYETDDQEEIELIKKLNNYGTEIYSGDGETTATPEAIKRFNTERNAIPEALACPRCSFKAKSGLGLSSHVRKHDRDEQAAEEAVADINTDDFLPPPPDRS